MRCLSLGIFKQNSITRFIALVVAILVVTACWNQIAFSNIVLAAGGFSEGLAAVRVGSKAGYTNKSGNFVIQPKYKYAFSFSEGLALVRLDTGILSEAKDILGIGESQFGFVNSKGEVKIYINSTTIPSSFSEGLARVCSKGKCGFINKSGKIAILPKFNWVKIFSEGLAAVAVSTNSGSLWGFIDKTGSLVVEPQFQIVDNFAEGLARVDISDQTRGAEYIYINTKGEVAIPLKFTSSADRLTSFSEGLAAVRINEKWGYINQSGNIVIQPQFNYALTFSEGLAAVRIIEDETKKWGFVNRDEKLVIKPRFEDGFDENTRPFSDGLAVVTLNHKKGFIDKTGKTVIPFIFDEAKPFSEGLAEVKIGDEWSYVNKQGQKLTISKPKFFISR